MNYTDYIKGVSFKFMGPKNYFKGFSLTGKFFNKLNISLEVLNTSLPENKREMFKNLKELLEIPRMSTFAIGALIHKGVFEMQEKHCFLNIGVWHGFSFLSGLKGNETKKCIGVDNFSQFGGPRDQFINRFDKYKSVNHHFYDIDYKDYFLKIHSAEIGFYIYDGDHDYENQFDGLKTAEPFFAKNCIILIDDTNDDEPRTATLDFIKESSHHYEILLDETTLFNKHPTFWNGIMIFEKID
jgi:hypothetical protein